MYNFFVVNTTIVINVLYNRWNGPGGGTRHLHGGELGFDVRGKARLLLEVVLRKGIKRSANSTKMVKVANSPMQVWASQPRANGPRAFGSGFTRSMMVA